MRDRGAHSCFALYCFLRCMLTLIVMVLFSEPYRLSALEVAAIVIGCIIGTVILCCFLGSVIDCFMHVYKYWCSCLHKAYRSKCQTEMIALRNPNYNARYANNNEPTVLLVRAVPPSFSTIIVSCETAVSQDSSTNTTEQTCIRNTRVINSAQMILNASQQNGCTIINPHASINDEEESSHGGKSRDMFTQTSSSPRLACIRTRSCEERTSSHHERSRLLQTRERVQCLRESIEFTRVPDLVYEKSPTQDGPLPPSYSSIFCNEYVTYSNGDMTTDNFLMPPR